MEESVPNIEEYEIEEIIKEIIKQNNIYMDFIT